MKNKSIKTVIVIASLVINVENAYALKTNNSAILKYRTTIKEIDITNQITNKPVILLPPVIKDKKGIILDLPLEEPPQKYA